MPNSTSSNEEWSRVYWYDDRGETQDINSLDCSFINTEGVISIDPQMFTIYTVPYKEPTLAEKYKCRKNKTFGIVKFCNETLRKEY